MEIPSQEVENSGCSTNFEADSVHNTDRGAGGDHSVDCGVEGDHSVDCGVDGDHSVDCGVDGDHSVDCGVDDDHSRDCGVEFDHSTDCGVDVDHRNNCGVQGDYSTNCGVNGYCRVNHGIEHGTLRGLDNDHELCYGAQCEHSIEGGVHCDQNHAKSKDFPVDWSNVNVDQTQIEGYQAEDLAAILLAMDCADESREQHSKLWASLDTQCAAYWRKADLFDVDIDNNAVDWSNVHADHAHIEGYSAEDTLAILSAMDVYDEDFLVAEEFAAELSELLGTIGKHKILRAIVYRSSKRCRTKNPNQKGRNAGSFRFAGKHKEKVSAQGWNLVSNSLLERKTIRSTEKTEQTSKKPTSFLSKTIWTDANGVFLDIAVGHPAQEARSTMGVLEKDGGSVIVAGLKFSTPITVIDRRSENRSRGAGKKTRGKVIKKNIVKSQDNGVQIANFSSEKFSGSICGSVESAGGPSASTYQERAMLQVDGVDDHDSDLDDPFIPAAAAALDESWGRGDPQEMGLQEAKLVSTLFDDSLATLRIWLKHTEEVYFNKKCGGKIITDDALASLRAMNPNATSAVVDLEIYSSAVAAVKALCMLRKTSQNEGIVFGSEKCMSVLKLIGANEHNIQKHSGVGCSLGDAFYSFQVNLLRGYTDYLDKCLNKEAYAGLLFRDPAFVPSVVSTPIRKSIKSFSSPTTQIMNRLTGHVPEKEIAMPLMVSSPSGARSCRKTETEELFEKRTATSICEYIEFLAVNYFGEQNKCPFCQQAFTKRKNTNQHMRNAACDIIKHHVKSLKIQYVAVKPGKRRLEFDEKESEKVGQDAGHMSQQMAATKFFTRPVMKDSVSSENEANDQASRVAGGSGRETNISSGINSPGIKDSTENRDVASSTTDNFHSEGTSNDVGVSSAKSSEFFNIDMENPGPSRCSTLVHIADLCVDRTKKAERKKGTLKSKLQNLTSFVSCSDVSACNDTMEAGDSLQILRECKQNVLSGKYVVPAWLTELDPHFGLGKSVDNSVLMVLLYDNEAHRKYLDFVAGVLSPMYKHLDSAFEAETPEQPWDTAEEVSKRGSNLASFYRQYVHLLEVDFVAEPIGEGKTLVGDFYKPVKSDHALKNQFEMFLGSKKAKSKGTVLAKKTQELYISAVFSETRSNSFVSYCKGNGKEVWQYMFDPKGNFCNLPPEFDNFLSHGDNQSPASAKNACAGLQALVMYFRRAAQEFKVPEIEADHRFFHLKSEYLCALDICALRLKDENASLDKDAKSFTQDVKRNELVLDPEESGKRKIAFNKYFRGNHYTQQLMLLLDMTNKIRAGNRCTDSKWFSEIGHWLQYMLILNNGSRLQAGEILLNEHLGQCNSIVVDPGKPVKLTKNDLLDSDFIAMKAKGGKTGVVEVQVPKDLAVGFTNYYIVKKSLSFAMAGEDPLFVDYFGKPLSLKGLYLTGMYRTVTALMGVKDLKATGSRHVVATQMREMNLEGSTGMGHSVKTQELIYNDNTEQEGIQNKLKVHAGTYQKKVVSSVLGSEDLEYQVFVTEQFRDCRDDARQSLLHKQIRQKFKTFTESVQKRTQRKIMLSSERKRYLAAVFGCCDLEFSAFLLCPEDPPKRDQKWRRIFERFFTSVGRDVLLIREDCARIAAFGRSVHKDMAGFDEIKFVSDTYAKSIFFLNESRLRQSVQDHVVMKFKTLEDRFLARNERISKLMDAENFDMPQSHDEPDEFAKEEVEKKRKQQLNSNAEPAAKKRRRFLAKESVSVMEKLVSKGNAKGSSQQEKVLKKTKSLQVRPKESLDNPADHMEQTGTLNGNTESFKGNALANTQLKRKCKQPLENQAGLTSKKQKGSSAAVGTKKVSEKPVSEKHEVCISQQGKCLKKQNTANCQVSLNETSFAHIKKKKAETNGILAEAKKIISSKLEKKSKRPTDNPGDLPTKKQRESSEVGINREEKKIQQNQL